MSRTHHARIPGTHRAMTRAYRYDLDWDGENVRPVLPEHVAIHEGLAEVTIAARLSCDEPAKNRKAQDPGYGLRSMPKPSWRDLWREPEPQWFMDCACGAEVEVVDGVHADGLGVYCDEECFAEHGGMAQLTKALTAMSTQVEPWGGDVLADWEYDLMGLRDETGVTYEEYVAEFVKRNANEPVVVWSSEVDLEHERMLAEEEEQERLRREAEYDAEYGGYPDDESAWLPLVTLYDPTGVYEDCYDVFGGDGFIVEGPSRADRPSTKTSRDEWTVTSLARAWDVETSIMLAMLQDTALGNQSGLTASSRVPMHVISDQMASTIFGGPTQRYQRSVMWVWNALMMGYTDTPANRRMGTAARKPDAKRLKGEEEYAYRMGRLAEQWREVALTSECDSGCKVEVNGLDQSRVVHYSGYGCTQATTDPWGEPLRARPAGTMATSRGTRPYWGPRPGAPRPGSNPFAQLRKSDFVLRGAL